MNTTEVRSLKLSTIEESPTNPRKRFGDLEQLADSIVSHGVLQPVLVRPHPSKKNAFELIAGARRYRATKLAGLAEIPALVVQLDDAGVLEAQVIENNQRSDVHPLEEADGFLALQKTHGYTAEVIAAKIGRSPSYVYQRLKLTDLCEKGRNAYFDEKLTFASALIIARVPDEKLQAHILKQVAERPAYEPEPMAPSRVRELVMRNYTLRLADAPFDTKDAKLCAEAGACTTCPKRTKNQKELFADFGKDDLCTDVGCFREKRDVAWKARAAAAKAAGQTVLSDAEGKKLFPYGGTIDYKAAYVDLHGKDWQATGDKTWSQVIGKECPPVVLVRDPDGNVHELVDKKAAQTIVKKKKAAAKKDEPVSEEDEKWRKQREADDRKAKLEEATAAASLATLISVIEAKGMTADAWRHVMRCMIHSGDHLFELAERRGLAKKDRSNDLDEEALLDLVTVADDKAIAGLVVEACVRDACGRWANEKGKKAFAWLLEEMGVDQKKIASEIAAAEKAKKKGKSAA